MTTVAGGREGEAGRGHGGDLGESATTARYWRRPTIRMKPVAPPRADREATRGVLMLVIEDDAPESSHVLRVDDERGRPDDSVVGFWQPSNASFTIVVAASVALAVAALATMLVLARTNVAAPRSASEPASAPAARVAAPSEELARSPARAAVAASAEVPPPAIPVIDVMSLPAAPTGSPAAR